MRIADAATPIKAPAGRSLAMSWRLAMVIVCLSLTPRLITLAVFSHYDVPPVFDEGGYFIRADGAARAAANLMDFDREGIRSGAYSWFGGGKWPPLYPAMLAIGFPLFEDNVVGARFINVLASAATSLLVYLLTIQLTRKQPSAIVTTAAHILHPTIIAYAVLLWSETVFTLFLVLGLYLSLRALEQPHARSKKWLYIASGAALGATALVRAASLPLLFLWPLLVLYLERGRGRSLGLRQAAWMSLAIIVVVLPYEAALCGFHRKFVLLSPASDYNLYLGNNPWAPMENGSSWGDNPSKAKVHRAMAAGDVAGELARREIIDHPVKFLQRSIMRLRMLWTPDFFPIRHVLSASAPPTYAWAILLLLATTLIAFVFVLGWGIFGFLVGDQLQPGGKLLLLGTAAGLTIGPMATISMSRLHFSMTVLLLPLAFIGTLTSMRPFSAKNLLYGVMAIGFVVFALSSIPVTVGQHLLPSSFYSAWLTPVGGHLERSIEYRDLIVIRAADDAEPIELNLFVDPELCQASLIEPYSASGGWESKKLAGRRHFNDEGSIHVRLHAGQEIEVALVGYDLSTPLELTVWDERSNSFRAEMTPAAWKRLQQTDIPGVSYRWD